jgi:hypothetical protein
LSNPNGGSNADQDKKDDSEALAKSDFQLYEALNLLKGLNILSNLNAS